MMTKCFNLNTKHRPDFAWISTKFEQLREEEIPPLPVAMRKGGAQSRSGKPWSPSPSKVNGTQAPAKLKHLYSDFGGIKLLEESDSKPKKRGVNIVDSSESDEPKKHKKSASKKSKKTNKNDTIPLTYAEHFGKSSKNKSLESSSDKEVSQSQSKEDESSISERGNLVLVQSSEESDSKQNEDDSDTETESLIT